MKIYSAIFLILSGCSSLHSQMGKIHTGDSYEKVVSTLGQPTAFQKNAEYDVVGYKRGGDICAIALKNDEVSEIQCQEDPTYIGPGKRALIGIAGAMHGMGDGLQHAHDHTVNCYTSGPNTYCN